MNGFDEIFEFVNRNWKNNRYTDIMHMVLKVQKNVYYNHTYCKVHFDVIKKSSY